MDGIESLLTKRNIQYRTKGKDLVVSCLNPEHEDSNPSCRIDKVTGAFHCFSCGFKGNIFKFFGIITNNTSIKVSKLKEKLKDLTIELSEVTIPGAAIPVNTVFRGISTTTLRHFGAFRTDAEDKLVDRICFPITDITGKTIAYLGRHLLSNGNPRYVVHPGGRPLPLFPSNLGSQYRSIVLVEGIFDMLRLYDSGIKNAVCAFGTSTISEANAKNKLMPYKAQGVTKVFLMFDGDKAGEEAMKNIKPILEECDLSVEIVELEGGTDPGDMDNDTLQSLKEYITEYENSSN